MISISRSTDSPFMCVTRVAFQGIYAPLKPIGSHVAPM
jgi:hypothetical protein